jgi:Amidohydrolase family
MKTFTQLFKPTPLASAVLVWVFCCSASAQEPPPATVAFTNVNVIPLDRERVAARHTVVVRAGRIVAVGASDVVPVPADAVVIDGVGQYLVPGLTDAHVHVSGTPIMQTRDDFGDAPMYLAYGVTTVVNLSGSPAILEWRKNVEAGVLPGPTIYTAGPFVNEPRVNTPDEVERDIVAQAQAGYDLIKFHEFVRTTTGLSRSAYRRMIETARRSGIPLIGHSPLNLGIDEMLRQRQSIAHVGMLSNIYFLPFSSNTTILLVTIATVLVLVGMALASAVASVTRRFSRRQQHPSGRRSVATLNAAIALAAVSAFLCGMAFLPGGPLFDSTSLRVAFTVLSAMVAAGTMTAALVAVRLLRDAAVPTIGKIHASLVGTSALALTVVMLAFWVPVSWRSSDGGVDRVAKRVRDAGVFVQSTLVVYDTFSASGRAALIDDRAVDLLMPALRVAWRREPRGGIPFNRLTGFMQKIVGALHRNGVPIMAGTDAMGLPLVPPGRSLHREFGLLAASGLSPYEVIRSATVVPAAFLGRSQEFGTIAPDQRADLLLVDGNPLENLTVLEHPNGVMVRGTWLPRREIDERLKRLAGE